MWNASDIPICEGAKKKSFTFLSQAFEGRHFRKFQFSTPVSPGASRLAFGVWRFVLVLVVVPRPRKRLLAAKIGKLRENAFPELHRAEAGLKVLTRNMNLEGPFGPRLA